LILCNPFLSNQKYFVTNGKKHYIEQNTFALENQNILIPLINSKQICFSQRKTWKIDVQKLVAIHFVGPYRYLFRNLKIKGIKIVVTYNQKKKFKIISDNISSRISSNLNLLDH
jgi:hypothetical protein